MKITFENVGRNKAGWTSECKKLDYDTLYKECKPHLLSNNIDFDYNSSTKTGNVYAGIRQVGTFKWEE